MHNFYCDCVGWPRHEMKALSELIDSAIQITRKTFLKYVDHDQLKAIESGLGYSEHHKQGLTMAGDYHVSYHRGQLNGKVAYYFSHSCIEYVFKAG